DRFLRVVGEVLTDSGVKAERVSHLQYAAMATIRVDDHGESYVTPDVPLLLRRWQAADAAGISAFSLNENYAHVWSAAALTRSPVVNRPGANGAVNMHPRRLIPRLHASAPDLRHLIPCEWYADDGQPTPDQESEVLAAYPLADGDHHVPRRFRNRKPAGWVYARTIVAGDHAWQSSRLDDRMEWLEPLTASVAGALDLSLCQITWRAQPRERLAQVARICAEPGPAELGTSFDVAARRIARYLTP
ncbi:MAG TPA: hypothetical protein VI365_16220, partial [Trebonia sp.]